jgi:hypothetical protein
MEPVTTGWKAVGGFFRVFDIAFFLPGAIVLLGCLRFKPAWLKTLTRDVLSGMGGPEQAPALPAAVTKDGPVSEVPPWLAALALVITFVVLVFVLGLICHALARVIRSLAMRFGSWMWVEKKVRRRPYRKALNVCFALKLDRLNPWLEDSTQVRVKRGQPRPENDDLMLYLWNMATLCWNISVAFLGVAGLALGTEHWGSCILLTLLAFLLAMLGSEFRYFWDVTRPDSSDSHRILLK